MRVEEIKKDIKFRQRCGLYGIDWNNCEICDDVILLNTHTNGLYVFCDKNYNTIGVEFINFSRFSDKYELVKDKYYEYSNIMDGMSFDYPFEKFTLKDIIDLSNYIEVMEDYQGHAVSTIVNGKLYDRTVSLGEEYFQLLSYIKFLGEEIKKYFLISYHMLSIGIEIPNVYEYVRLLISRVDECVNFHLYHNTRPSPAYILSGLGQNYRELKMSGILCDVSNLLMKEKGYKIKDDSQDEVVKTDDMLDLSVISSRILKILCEEDMDNILKNKKMLVRKNNRI